MQDYALQKTHIPSITKINLVQLVREIIPPLLIRRASLNLSGKPSSPYPLGKSCLPQQGKPPSPYLPETHPYLTEPKIHPHPAHPGNNPFPHLENHPLHLRLGKETQP